LSPLKFFSVSGNRYKYGLLFLGTWAKAQTEKIQNAESSSSFMA
jgi:hypothetical protein